MATAVCNWWNKLVKKLVNYKGDWLRENRGSLMTVAALIVTITFQPAIAPPGGVWQNTTYPTYDDSGNLTSVPPNSNTDLVCYPYYNGGVCMAGTAVLAYLSYLIFSLFIVFDTVSFLASLAALFLLIIGFPRENNKVSTWILTITVCISLSSLGFTFVFGMLCVLPFYDDRGPLSLNKVVAVTIYSWLGLFAIGTLIIVVLSLCQFVKCCVQRFSGGEDDDRRINQTHQEEEEEELQPYSTEEP